MSAIKQRGMTGIGWLIVLGLVAFFATVAVKVSPIYMEGFQVRKALESIKKEPGVTAMSEADILRLIRRRLDVNNISSVKKDNIKVERRGGRLHVGIAFEIRRHLLGNLDVVGVYSEKLELVQN